MAVYQTSNGALRCQSAVSYITTGWNTFLLPETNLTAGVVNATLISLRLKGLIKQLPGSLFVKG